MAHFMYRHWSYASRNIYAGTTNNPDRRERRHEKESSWWPQVRNITYEQYPTRTEALWAEWVSIVTEQPPNNKHLIRAGLPFPRPTTPLARIAFRLAMALGEWPEGSK